MDEVKEVWYFTFGVGEEYGNRKSKYVKITGDFSQARAKMIQWYGHKWCGQYSEEQFENFLKKYPIEEYDEGINYEW